MIDWRVQEQIESLSSEPSSPSARSSMTMRPASSPPIVMSKKTFGFGPPLVRSQVSAVCMYVSVANRSCKDLQRYYGLTGEAPHGCYCSEYNPF